MKVRSENEPYGPPLLPDRVFSVTLRPRIPASWHPPLFSLVLSTSSLLCVQIHTYFIVYSVHWSRGKPLNAHPRQLAGHVTEQSDVVAIAPRHVLTQAMDVSRIR